MFEVLHRDESDDEDKKPKRLPKKEARAVDLQRREAEGDYAPKDSANRNFQHDGKRDKSGYSGTGKRTHDRHSGKGDNAHNKYEKKGGHGKGNWGSKETEDHAEGGENAPRKESVEQQEPEEPEEPVVTLGDYFKDNNISMQNELEEDPRKITVTTTNEKGMHVLKKKEADYVEAGHKTKNIDNIARAGNGIEFGKPEYKGKKNWEGKPKTKKLGNDDFPALG